MEQHLAKFPKKRKTSRSILKFSEIPQKFSFHSTLFPEFLEYLIEWFAFWKFNSFQNFWKLFRKMSVPFAVVSKFSKVLVEKIGKRPLSPSQTEPPAWYPKYPARFHFSFSPASLRHKEASAEERGKTMSI